VGLVGEVTMKSELVPLNGDPPIRITRDVTVVGRREYCDVQIDHPSLSKRHCVLVRTDGLLMLRDLATTNGSKVNGQRVMWAALLPNDRLTLGAYKVRVYLGPDDQASPAERVAQGRDANESSAIALSPSVGPSEFPTPHPDILDVVPPHLRRDEPRRADEGLGGLRFDDSLGDLEDDDSIIELD
jgi:predicted component of type VI protein secretion system